MAVKSVNKNSKGAKSPKLSRRPKKAPESRTAVMSIIAFVVVVLLGFEAVSLFKTPEAEIFLTAQMIGRFSGSDQPCGKFGAWDVTAVGNDKIAVADPGGRVLFFDRSGKYLQSWGKKGQGPGDLNEPSAIICDPQKNVYFVYAWKSCIIGLDEKVKKNFWLPLSGFYGARGLAWDGQSFYVADTGTHRVVKLSPKGETVGVWGNGEGDGKNQLRDPRSLVVDSKGFIYTADYENARVQILDPTPGKFVKTIKIGQKASAIMIDSKNRLFVASMDGNFVKVFTTEGKFLGRLKDEKGAEESFRGISGMGFTPDGILLLAADNMISEFRVP